MKIPLLLLFTLLLAGCDNRPLDQHEYTLQKLTNIPELKDCVFIQVSNLKIIRCPNSSVLTNWQVKSGKSNTTKNISVID